MSIPTIIVGEKKYKPKKPKVKLWRKIVEYNRKYGGEEEVADFHANIEIYEAILDLLAECFGNPEITPEIIEENVDLDELMPKFYEVTGWVAETLTQNAQQLPSKN